MRTIIDRATAAAGAEVCSVYLVDRDGSGVTLAATNGLDRDQIGVARLPMGVGITGRAAQTRRPQVSLNVRRDRRFAWLQGLDEPRLTSMCSVPLLWNDAVVGVLNVQTVRRRVVPAERRPVPRDARRTPGRHRREGTPPGRGRGPGRQPPGDRRSPGQPRHDRHPRAPDAARGRSSQPRADRCGGPPGRPRPDGSVGGGGAPPGRPARLDGRFDPGQPACPARGAAPPRAGRCRAGRRGDPDLARADPPPPPARRLVPRSTAASRSARPTSSAGCSSTSWRTRPSTRRPGAGSR